MNIKRLKALSYYQTGGTADLICAPSSLAELASVTEDIFRKGLPLFLLGGGTNSLVMDEHWPGAVIAFHQLRKIDESESGIITCEAGVDNSDLARHASGRSLSGAAWMYRLPGQIGGTVRMNARCYGGEISQIVTGVTSVTKTGAVKHYDSAAGLFRGYKDTIFMDNGEIVAEVNVALKPGDAAEIRRKMKACEDDRVAKGQFQFPSCGCVFKNDYSVGVPSGALLDTAGAKALSRGGASVSPFHANFVYNKNGASSREILELTIEMRELVFKHFGVWMEYEMEILGQMPKDLEAKVKEKREGKIRLDLIKPMRKP